MKILLKFLGGLVMGSVQKRLADGSLDEKYINQFSLESQVLGMQEHIYLQDQKMDKILSALELFANGTKDVLNLQKKQITELDLRLNLVEKSFKGQDMYNNIMEGLLKNE